MTDIISARRSLSRVDRRDGEVAALDARTMAHVAALDPRCPCSTALLAGGDLEEVARIWTSKRTSSNTKNSSLGAEHDGVADAGRGFIGLGALGGRARAAGVELAGRGLDDVADDDQRAAAR